MLYGGIGFTVPLFDGFQTRARIGEAEAQFEKMKGQKSVLEKGLSAQVDYLHTTLAELKERVKILSEAIRDAEERLNLASDGYAAGITEYEQLLLAEKAELEIRSIYVQALFAHQLAKAEIEFVSGAE